MKILRLDCTGVRGIPDGSYAFTDPRTGAPLGLVLVTGGPASGKTSLLEAIAAVKEAVGSYGGPVDPMRIRRQGADSASITATWLLSAAERDRAGLEHAEQTVTWDLSKGSPRAEAEPGLRRLFSEFSRAPERGKMEYFPANRALTGNQRITFGRPSAKAEARLRAARARDKYDCIFDGLRDLALGDLSRAARALRERTPQGDVPDALEAFKLAVAAVLPELRLSGFDLGDGGGLQFLRGAHELVSVDELSDSEQQGALFALAFAYFGLSGSIILIDEPELHIHAADRVRFLEAVAALGADNQIIAATGAEELVAWHGRAIDLRRGANGSHDAGHRTAVPEIAAVETTTDPSPGTAPERLWERSSSRAAGARPCEIPSYLQPPPAAPLVAPLPSALQEDGDETAQLGVFISGPALPFARPGEEPSLHGGPARATARDDAGATSMLPTFGTSVPTKRLVRFDPQTGHPLPEPRWEDVPEAHAIMSK